MPAIPDAVPSIRPYKLPLPPSPDEKLRASLLVIACPAPNLPPIAIPHTPLWPGAASIMTALRSPDATPKTPALNFRCQCEVIVRYVHVVYSTQLSPICFELSAAAWGGFPHP